MADSLTEGDACIDGLQGPESVVNMWVEGDLSRRWSSAPNQGNPRRNEQIALIVELASAVQPARILDLGCGSGAVAFRLLERLPHSTLVGLDGAPGFPHRAHRLVAAFEKRVQLVQARLEHDWTHLLKGPFDLVVAVQAVHHLDRGEKQRLFHRVAGLLNPGGMFLLSDRIELSHPDLLPSCIALENRARVEMGFPTQKSPVDLDAHRKLVRLRGDIPEKVETQMSWMRTAGLHADCLWRYGARAIIVGFRS